MMMLMTRMTMTRMTMRMRQRRVRLPKDLKKKHDEKMQKESGLGLPNHIGRTLQGLSQELRQGFAWHSPRV